MVPNTISAALKIKNSEPTYSCLTFPKACAERNRDKVLTHFQKKCSEINSNQYKFVRREKSIYCEWSYFSQDSGLRRKAQETRLFENYKLDV